MKHQLTNDRPYTASITWEISNRCNYACWYCPEHLHNGTEPWPDHKKALDFISEVAARNIHVNLDLAGGEPTLWPHFLKFFSTLPSNVVHEFTTNGSRTLKWWEKSLPVLKTVCVSHHAESADINHLVKVALLLKEHCHLVFHLMLDPNHRNKTIELADRLDEISVAYTVMPIYPDFGNQLIPYGDDDLALLKRHRKAMNTDRGRVKPGAIFIDGERVNRSDLLVEGRNNFQGWLCLAGTKRFNISFDGTIYAAACRVKTLGTLKEGWSLPQGALVCDRPGCWCVDDVRTEKFCP